MADNSKKGRKIGRNKKSPSMKNYPYRAIKNKARKARTHAAMVERDATRIARRIKAGKPVHKRHKPKAAA